jgi:hypothetical protein
MNSHEKPIRDADQQRLELSQPGSTWFYLRHPKVTLTWLVVLVGCAAFVAFRH